MTQRPSWWNEALKQQRAFEAWLERREIILARRIGAARNKFVRDAANQYAMSPDTTFAFLMRNHRERIERILVESYTKVIPERAGVTLDAVRSLKRWPQYNGYFARLVQMWIAMNAGANATTIAATAMADVRRAIDRGAAEGKGSREIGREIRKVTGLTVSRALTVARTEIHGAALFASEEISKQAERDFGVRLMKFWIPTLDARTRDAHAEMAGNEGVPMDGKFNVGGKMMSRPSDPAGGAANVINCRCSLIYREVEYAIE